jgi:hypothetical protein
MNDDLPPDERPGAPGGEHAGPPAADRRDERVSSLLEVPPLDDVTRRRLVTRALSDAGFRRDSGRRVLVPAVAALVVLVLVGVSVLVLLTRGDGEGGTAARPKAPAPDAQPRRPEAGAAEAPPAGIPDLGELGDLSDPAELRPRVDAARRNPTSAARETAPACLDRAVGGSPPPEAFGTGTHNGRAVLVLVLPAGNEADSVVLLDQETCRAVTVVSLS